MSFYYPLKFSYEGQFDETMVKTSKSTWLSSRGFSPKSPTVFNNCLVISLYSESNDFLTYQLRDLSTNDTELKYKLVDYLADLYVKTDDKEIDGVKVLCEGTIDTLILREQGINAYTTLGLKKGRLNRLLSELNETFVFIGDNDIYGDLAVKKLQRRATIFQIPRAFKDVNDFMKLDLKGFESFIVRLKMLTVKQPISML
jgi:hypothetical protein